MSKKLLLADDSITIQKVIGITFAHEDYVLTIVDNGDAALNKARVEHPDLILADIHMPGKNGYEVCAAVKRDPQLGHIPVLLLTGTFEPFDEAKAKAAGADSWIAKPFESQALIDRVEQLLARAAAAPAPAPKSVATAAPAAAVPVVATPAAAEPATETPAADFWGELQIDEEEPVENAADLKEDLWAQPAAGSDDLWGTISQDAGGEAETPENDDWSGLAAELDTAPAPGRPAGIGIEGSAKVDTFVFSDSPLEEESSFLDEPLSSPGPEEGAFSFEEPAAGDSFSFEQPASPPQKDSPRFDAFSESAQEDPFAFDVAGTEVETTASSRGPAAPGNASWPEKNEMATEWGGFEEEILPLDENDIIEEEDLQEVGASAHSDVYEQGRDEALFAEEIPDLAARSLLPERKEERKTAEIGFPTVAAGETGGAEDFLSEEEAFPIDGELPPIDEPDWGLTDEETEPATPMATKEPAVAEPPYGRRDPAAGISSPRPAVAPGAASTALAVDEKMAALSDEEIARIVEKVAGPLIERLAAAMLEKIAWEVVPDLAESMIRDEIRKIRESVAH